MMKKLLLLILLPAYSFALSPDCSSVHSGVFRIDDRTLETTYLIIREGNKQYEIDEKTNGVTQYTLAWTDDCTYTLSDRKVLKGKDDAPEGFYIEALYNNILEMKGRTHVVETTCKEYELKIRSEIIPMNVSVKEMKDKYLN